MRKFEEEYNVNLKGYPKEMMCWDEDESSATKRLVICKDLDDDDYYPYKTITNKFTNAKDIVPEVRTIKDGLVKGDEITNMVDNEYVQRLIVGVCDDVVFCRNNKRVYYEGSDPYQVGVFVDSIQELIALGYEIVQPEPKDEIVRLTHKDISEGKGKGVPSHLIMIVED